MLNPARVKAYRKALPEEDKLDSNDPKLIDQYYRAVGVEHPYQFNDRYLRLRFLSRAYCRLIHTLASEKAYFRSVLYLVASQYQPYQPFSDVFGTTSQYILSEYVDIQAIAEIPGETTSGPQRNLGDGIDLIHKSDAHPRKQPFA